MGPLTIEELALLIALVGKNLDPKRYPNRDAKILIGKCQLLVGLVEEVTKPKIETQILRRHWTPSMTDVDKDYLITWRERTGDHQRTDYRCTCLAFAHASWSDTYECKHIKALKEDQAEDFVRDFLAP